MASTILKSLKPSGHYSANAIANVAGVNYRTVVQWLEANGVKPVRLPLKHRRYLGRDVLRAMAKSHQDN